MIKNLVTYVYDRLRALAALFIRFYPAWLNKLLPADKALHLAFGFTLAMVPALFGYPVFGLLLACSAGLFKEVIDLITGKGAADRYDGFSTYCGGLIAYFAFSIAAFDSFVGLSIALLFVLAINFVFSHRD